MPSKYSFFYLLRLPVGETMKKKWVWNGVIDKFSKKLNHWKAKVLSIEGRLTLSKSVLTALPLYFFFLFKAPEGVIRQLEGIRRRFFWGFADNSKGIYWVAWNKVMGAKENGGLNIQSLKVKNLALLAKCFWRYFRTDDALCKSVIS